MTEDIDWRIQKEIQDKKKHVEEPHEYSESFRLAMKAWHKAASDFKKDYAEYLKRREHGGSESSVT